MATPDEGAAVVLLVPTTATLDDGSTVRVDTSYPFEDTVRISCATNKSGTSFPLYIRVPAWATNATINGKPVTAASFSKHSCTNRSVSGLFTLELNPAIVLEEWAGDKHGGDALHIAYSVVRGPLLYSLPIAHDYIVYDHHFGRGDDASNDLFLVPSASDGNKWNYALALDPSNLTNGALIFDRQGSGRDGWVVGTAPFNRTGSLSIKARARRVPSWKIYANSAAPPPRSPACAGDSQPCGAEETIELVPHGFTELRIGEFPLA
jgi:hypothetical protein